MPYNFSICTNSLSPNYTPPPHTCGYIHIYTLIIIRLFDVLNIINYNFITLNQHRLLRYLLKCVSLCTQFIKQKHHTAQKLAATEYGRTTSKALSITMPGSCVCECKCIKVVILLRNNFCNKTLIYFVSSSEIHRLHSEVHTQKNLIL